MNLSICVPCKDTLCSGFAYDLAMLTAHWYAKMPAGSRMDLHMRMGTYISDQRQQLAKMAIAAKADWILYLDSDMRFPRDIVERLMAHDKDIMCVNYPTRRFPVTTVAWTNFEELEYVTSHDKSGIQKIDAAGFGAVLIKADIFKKLPLPWFNIAYSHAGQSYFGEDIWFCKLAQGHGFEVWLDHDVSKEVKHIGTIEFMHEHVAACLDDVKLAAE